MIEKKWIELRVMRVNMPIPMQIANFVKRRKDTLLLKFPEILQWMRIMANWEHTELLQ